VPRSDELSEIRQRSIHFGCWENLCCYEIPEAPTRIILVQPVLEAIEGVERPKGL
jgi:hypothetical protein